MPFPQKLYRNTELQYAKTFVEAGEIMFRPLTYYRNIEDPVRRDDKDGIFEKNGPAKNVWLTFHDLPDDHKLKGVPTKHVTVGNVKVTIPTPSADSMLISCFSTTMQNSFGDGAIEIFDVAGFIKCVDAKLAEDSLGLVHDLVEYYDSSSHMPVQNKLWLQKDKNKFATQKEFRLGIVFSDAQIEQLQKQGKNFTSMTNLLLRCGSLKKFARLKNCSIKYYFSKFGCFN